MRKRTAAELSKSEPATSQNVSETRNLHATNLVVEFVREHGVWASPIAFVLAFGESLPFISLLIPAWAALVGIGLLIGAGPFVQRWGAPAIFIGRFFGPLRASVPLAAGIFRMSYWHFQIANFSSAFVWAGLLLGFGDVVGMVVEWLWR